MARDCAGPPGPAGRSAGRGVAPRLKGPPADPSPLVAPKRPFEVRMTPISVVPGQQAPGREARGRQGSALAPSAACRRRYTETSTGVRSAVRRALERRHLGVGQGDGDDGEAEVDVDPVL